jgi:hypothetical protein
MLYIEGMHINDIPRTGPTGIISTISEKGHPERITRIIRTHDGTIIKQVSQGLVEGTTDQYYWWNIDIR